MGKLLLVIDDDPIEREVLERALTGPGFRVVTAADGQSRLVAVASSRPDLIVLDVMMPRLNSYQTCRALRRDPATARCPILMLTAKAEPTDRHWATEVGADAELTGRT